MFDHVIYEVSDLETSANFYEKALAVLGHKKLVHFPKQGVIGFGMNRPQFWIAKANIHPEANKPHVCFTTRNREEVKAFYQAALAAGGRDNGPPGIRREYHENYFGAFVLDPDGYNIEAVYHLPE